MSTIALAGRSRTYLNTDYAIRSWFLTTDHKRIAILYLVSITLMFLVGGVAATLMSLFSSRPFPTCSVISWCR